MKSAKYKEEVRNSFKMPPLVAKHKVTPSNYSALNQRMLEEDSKRRQSKTPFIENGSNFQTSGEGTLMSINKNEMVNIITKQRKPGMVTYESIQGFPSNERPKTRRF